MTADQEKAADIMVRIWGSLTGLEDDFNAAVLAAIRQEREACALLIEQHEGDPGFWREELTQKIRMRGK